MATTNQTGLLDSAQLTAGDTFFQTMNNRLRPDQLQLGQVAYSQNGRMALDGSWQTRRGANFLGGAISVSSEALVIPFYLYATVNISSASRSGTTVTVDTSTAHGFTNSTQVGIAGLTGTVDPNGNRTITVVDNDTFTFTIAGATGSETYGGTGTAGAPYINDQTNFAFGSCLFSDPTDDNSEYFIVALSDKAIAVSKDDGSSTDIDYPAGITITENVRLIQAFSKVFLFRNGATALEWNGSFSGTPAFAKVANGAYAIPAYLDAANNTAIADGVATVTESSHGFSVGDRVYVIDNGATSLTERNGWYIVATVPTSGSFTFRADVPDVSSATVVYAKRQPSQLGFTHMPAPPWGVYHQRRLIVPFFYTTTGTSGSEVITDREVRDELLISDVFDSDTYDQVFAQLKVTAGISDYLQHVHPFTDDNAVVFNRNSIHLLSGLSGDIGDMTLREITREAGLVAQRSVVTIGNRIFFLSDNGVYATEFGDLYNLRGAGLPLSDPIDPVVKRINSAYAANSVGIFHDNRYYLAVPIDDSTQNNAVLVYNLLNGGWESVDVFSDGFDIANLISAGSGGVKALYAVNRLGGVHRLESRMDDNDYIVTGAGVSAAAIRVDSYVKTRQYNFGSTERKKFNKFELHVESSDTSTSNGTISVETENTDSSSTLGTIADYYGAVLPVSEDASLRGRIGNMRGYGIQFTIEPTIGRPKIRMLSVGAIPAFSSLTSAS